jgi:hypothetical protein
MVEIRKVRDSLLTMNYTAVYVYNHSITNVRKRYKLSDHVLGFIIIKPSPITFYDFTSLGS